MVGPWSNFGEGWQTNKIMPLAPRARGPDLTPPRPKRSGSRQFLQGIASYPSKQKKPRRLGRGLVIGGLRKIETHEPALPTLHQDLTSKFPITKRCNDAWYISGLSQHPSQTRWSIGRSVLVITGREKSQRTKGHRWLRAAQCAAEPLRQIIAPCDLN